MSLARVTDLSATQKCLVTGQRVAAARGLQSSDCLRSTSNHFLRGTTGPVGPGVEGTGRLLSAQRLQRGSYVVAMAGKVTGKISLALEAGKANPAPPVGPALGAKGVNIMDFCKRYNAETADKAGQIIPVEITVYEDRTFTFITKTPPASFLLKEAAGVKKGAGNPKTEKLGQVTREQLKTIAETKLPDLNCTDIDAAMRTIEGTAKNMGIAVVES